MLSSWLSRWVLPMISFCLQRAVDSQVGRLPTVDCLAESPSEYDDAIAAKAMDGMDSWMPEDCFHVVGTLCSNHWSSIPQPRENRAKTGRMGARTDCCNIHFNRARSVGQEHREAGYKYTTSKSKQKQGRGCCVCFVGHAYSGEPCLLSRHWTWI